MTADAESRRESRSDGWFSESEFWARFAPFMFDERRWAEAPAVASGALAMAGAGPGARVLDLCCGPGRVAMEFAALGRRVTGLDLDPALLRAARESAEDRGLDIEWILGDARSPEAVPRARFDACFNLYTSIGYFDDPSDDLAMLERAFDSLAPGGVLVVETVGKECAARDFVPNEWYEKDGALLLASSRPADSWRVMEHRWIAVTEGGRFEREIRIRLYDGDAMARLFESAGFRDVSIHGDFDGSPYDEEARTMVARGEKPDKAAGKANAPLRPHSLIRQSR
jgi:SAM-dependent methyltransferase